jgi:hypothetical protein
MKNQQEGGAENLFSLETAKTQLRELAGQMHHMTDRHYVESALAHLESGEIEKAITDLQDFGREVDTQAARIEAGEYDNPEGLKDKQQDEAEASYLKGLAEQADEIIEKLKS